VPIELKSVSFPGPAGALEGLWKDASGPRRGSAVFAHPHPLHGGTLHNKVVYRACQALAAAGYATLRFNFRGVGRSEGRHDAGRGEVDDYRAALDEAVARGGLPLVAGGFSFGSSMALSAGAADPRVSALVLVGLPVASVAPGTLPKPRIPALFVTGERDTFGPPARLPEFVGDSSRIVIVPGGDHFFEGKLEPLGEAIGHFLAELPVGASA
jgi:alpha/beta superfamily hydrolase